MKTVLKVLAVVLALAASVQAIYAASHSASRKDGGIVEPHTPTV